MHMHFLESRACVLICSTPRQNTGEVLRCSLTDLGVDSPGSPPGFSQTNNSCGTWPKNVDHQAWYALGFPLSFHLEFFRDFLCRLGIFCSRPPGIFGLSGIFVDFCGPPPTNNSGILPKAIRDFARPIIPTALDQKIIHYFFLFSVKVPRNFW